MNDFVELSSVEYITEDIMPELLLLTSLVLRCSSEFVIGLSGGPEYKSIERRKRNTWLELLVPSLIRGKRELFYSSQQPSLLLLPDVCLNCLTSLGLTVAGRLRISCPHCPSTDSAVKRYIELMEEMSVFAVPNILFETLISQLLYKYYSPNGDRSWTLKIPNL
jgi:hypothetical protein